MCVQSFASLSHRVATLSSRCKEGQLYAPPSGRRFSKLMSGIPNCTCLSVYLIQYNHTCVLVSHYWRFRRYFWPVTSAIYISGHMTSSKVPNGWWATTFVWDELRSSNHRQCVRAVQLIRLICNMAFSSQVFKSWPCLRSNFDVYLSTSTLHIARCGWRWERR